MTYTAIGHSSPSFEEKEIFGILLQNGDAEQEHAARPLIRGEYFTVGLANGRWDCTGFPSTTYSEFPTGLEQWRGENREKGNKDLKR